MDENGPFFLSFIVDWPIIKDCDFPWQTVSLPEGNSIQCEGDQGSGVCHDIDNPDNSF